MTQLPHIPSQRDRFVVAYRERSEAVIDATARLTEAIRADVTAGLLPEQHA